MTFGFARNLTLAFSSSISSVYLLFTSTWHTALGTHAMTVLFSGLSVAFWLKFKGNKQKGLWLLTMLPIAFIPGFCVVGLPGVLIYGARPPKVEEQDLTMLVPTPKLPFKPLQFDSQLSFSRGGLFEVLERSSDPDKRLVAVMATTRMQPQQAIPLLKIAMRDAVDDVRLLAYSIKDKHESTINENIKELSEGLGLSGSASDTSLDGQEVTQEQASAFRSLAFAYWELVYLELAEGQIRLFCLEQTIEHAERALHILRDAPLAALLARAQLQRGDTQAATDALAIASEFGMQPETLAPHKAEIAFFEQRYDDIPKAMAALKDIKHDSLYDVNDYWRKTA